MIPSIDDYRDIVGDKVVDNLYEEAKDLAGKHITHVNSTFMGGGVAEILNTLVPLMNGLGMQIGWRILKAVNTFYSVTKEFHNGLQGAYVRITDREKALYLQENETNSVFTHLVTNHDAIVIHDPQPLALINFYQKGKQPWVWRCHIDLSHPNREVWDFLKRFIIKYNCMIVSSEKFKQPKLRVPQHIIKPSINPLVIKNKQLSSRTREAVLRKHGIDLDKPIIAQISRFDPWKDPLGVVEAYKKVKKQVNCRLVLMGNMASDDPEGPKIYHKVRRKIEKENLDVNIVMNSPDNDRVVNSLQTESEVIIQKSIREGFALTVTEALWKGTPVVGGNVGGIPSQVIDGKTGYLVRTPAECAKRVTYLLKNPSIAKKLGDAGKEHVRKNFLTTRHILDYMLLFKKVLKIKK